MSEVEQPLPHEDRKMAVARKRVKLFTECIRLESGKEMYCLETNKDGKQINIHRPIVQDEGLVTDQL